MSEEEAGSASATSSSGGSEDAVVENLRRLRAKASSPTRARSEILELLDPESFVEVGTFATFGLPTTDVEQKETGGGFLGGFGTIGGRSVVVCARDLSVFRLPPAAHQKSARLYQIATRRGVPFVEYCRTGQEALTGDEATLDDMRRRDAGEGPISPIPFNRGGRVPVIKAIVGDTYGLAALGAGMCDLLVQVEGTSLDAIPPASVEAGRPDATTIDMRGSASQHARSGLVDIVASNASDAAALVRRYLAFVARADSGLNADKVDRQGDQTISHLVPARRTLAYDCRRVIRRIVDDQDFFELKERFARNLVTGLGRIGGRPIGVVATAPIHSAGAMTPDACLKASSFVSLCDAHQLPIVILLDSPGFLVGTAAEQQRVVVRSMMFLQALEAARVPKMTVVVRKAFGLAMLVLAGARVGTDLVVAWPGAEIGFMDPPVAANVLFEQELAGLDAAARQAFMAEQIERLGVSFAPYGVAASLTIDEVIDPAETRLRVFEFLRSTTSDSGFPRSGRLEEWPRWY